MLDPKVFYKLEEASLEAQAAVAEYRKEWSSPVRQSLLKEQLKKQTGLFTDTEECWITDWFRGFLMIKGISKAEIEPLVNIGLSNSFWIKC